MRPRAPAVRGDRLCTWLNNFVCGEDALRFVGDSHACRSGRCWFGEAPTPFPGSRRRGRPPPPARRPRALACMSQGPWPGREPWPFDDNTARGAHLRDLCRGVSRAKKAAFDLGRARVKEDAAREWREKCEAELGDAVGAISESFFAARSCRESSEERAAVCPASEPYCSGPIFRPLGADSRCSHCTRLFNRGQGANPEARESARLNAEREALADPPAGPRPRRERPGRSRSPFAGFSRYAQAFRRL